MFPKTKNRVSNDVSGLINELLSPDTTLTPSKSTHNNSSQNLEIAPETCTKIHAMADKINVIAKKLSNNMPEFEAENVLYRLVSEISMLDMTVRSCLLEKRDESFFERERELVKSSRIHISTPANAIIRVTIPPLVGRQFRGSYNIYWKLKSALAQFERNHKFPRPEGEKLVLIYKRYSTNLAVGHTCDNDNWEMKRATNAISEALNYSDNSEHFSMVYTTVKSDTDCVEATVIKQKDMALFLDYLSEAKPEKNIFIDVK